METASIVPSNISKTESAAAAQRVTALTTVFLTAIRIFVVVEMGKVFAIVFLLLKLYYIFYFDTMLLFWIYLCPRKGAK